jgi:hypothetical protein
MMRNATSRRGGTIVLVLLLITVMTISLAAVYTLNGNETQVGSDEQEQLEALALAESGRNRFLIDRAGLGLGTAMPGATENVSIPYPGGRAEVTLTRIRAQVQQLPPIYLLRSRGVRTSVVHGNIPQAERTVSQYVFWDVQPLNLLAGWTSLSGLNKNGLNPNSITGVDLNPGTGGCPPTMSPIAAVAVPTVPGFTGNMGSLTGTPQVKPLGDAADTKSAVDIDWAGIVAGTADITYDAVIPPNPWPSFADPNFWPTIKYTGNLALNFNGRGTLIVVGNVVMSNNAHWDGILLVGGTLTSNGLTGVDGAVVTGLDILRGIAVPVSDVGNGDKAFHFNSCNASKALKQQAKLRAIPNTWMDNWASY